MCALVRDRGRVMRPSALAQTTGRLVGTIVDAQGAVLPGVTVTVTSPQLQGANAQVTDATGQFRFPSLPPGTYGVKAELAGFKTVGADGRPHRHRSDRHAAAQDVARRRHRNGQRARRLSRRRHHIVGRRRQRRPGADGTARRPPRHLRGDALRARRHAGYVRAVVLRIDERREQLHHRRPQHDRRRTTAPRARRSTPTSFRKFRCRPAA